MTWRARIAIGTILWFVVLLPTNHGFATDRDVRIGTEATYAPFEFKDQQGKLQGMEIDLADRYCSYSHLRCTFVEMSFDGLIPSLQSHQIDAILSEMAITEERKKAVAFTRPVTRGEVRIVASKASAITDEPATFAGKIVAVQSGTIEEGWARVHLAGIAGAIRVYETQDEAFSDLAAGRVDATLVAAAVGYDWLRKTASDTLGFVGGPIRDDAILGSGLTAIAVRKDDETLLQAFNASIRALLENGEYARINAKWLPFDVAPACGEGCRP